MKEENCPDRQKIDQEPGDAIHHVCLKVVIANPEQNFIVCEGNKWEDTGRAHHCEEVADAEYNESTLEEASLICQLLCIESFSQGVVEYDVGWKDPCELEDEKNTDAKHYVLIVWEHEKKDSSCH